ncbi:sulfate permease, SulP family [Dethiosulfatibacter aminovorans DSM 17477]|uniref:Sulfate permease, SulP family n=1 Tax=Dethiosulfatibacter aminovorans DSM 17477 TaxID=1121476 RepID=A0A1M6BVD4_9FIRM|nr:SulP family inorganic anion transporter [Dethiosulfatibacter aminovorans]SHI52756.1 sulfate permease, SulP family [Dethiosulfatibacter aminovorans DSM 17477]
MYLFNPLINTLKIYNKEYFKNDLAAASTVAVSAIPQSIAFAILAKIPPIYGLYSAIIGTIIISLFSSSSHIIGGPTTATCILIAGSLAAYINLPTESYMTVVFQFTFMVGIIQVLFGALNLGRILNFISHSVIKGFIIGVAFLSIFGQAGNAVGMLPPHGITAFQKVIFILSNIRNWNIYCIIIFTIACLTLYFTKKIHYLFPSKLAAMLATGLIAYCFDLEKLGVAVLGTTSTTLPSFNSFDIDFEMFLTLVPMALSYSIVSLMASITTAKTVAKNTHEKVDNNREFITQGIANIIGSFFQSFAGTGSNYRTYINYNAGGKTRIAGIMSGIIIALSLLLFGRYITYIPKACLAAIIITVASNMINFKEIIQYHNSSKQDFYVATITLAAIIFLPRLDRAVLIGTGVSIFLYLNESSSAKIKILHHVKYNDSFVEIDIDDLMEEEDMIAVRIEGNLYFGLAYDLAESLSEIKNKSDNFILRLRDVNSMDITSYNILLEFTQKIHNRGGNIKLSGVSEKMYKFLDKNGYFDHISKDDVFMMEPQIFSSFIKAMEKAKEEINAKNTENQKK